jgi:hypothetical protein
VSPNLAFTLMVLPPSPNLIVVDCVLPATFGGAVKVKDSLLPAKCHVPEPLMGLAENVAVNVPFELNSMTSLPLQEVLEPPGNGRLAGQSADWLAVAIEVWRHRPTSENESAGKLPVVLALQPNTEGRSGKALSKKIRTKHLRIYDCSCALCERSRPIISNSVDCDFQQPMRWIEVAD